MRIKLRTTLPVLPKHGMVEGRILDVLRHVPWHERERGDVAYYVAGDAGEEVGVLEREAERITSDKSVAFPEELAG